MGSDSGHGGFEVNVIGGGGRVSGDAGGGIEIGLRIGSGDGEREPEAAMAEDPVHRLETGAPLQAKPMSEVGPAVPRKSRRKNKGVGLKQWTLWMSLGTCALAISAVMALMAASKSKSPVEIAGEPYLEKQAEPLDPNQQYFLDHVGEMVQQAEALLKDYAGAASAEAVLPLVRDAERVKERLAGFWKPWGCSPLFARGEKIENKVVESGGRSAVVLTGLRGDFEPFEMFFVREDGELKIDWLASYGIGEVQIADLEAGGEVSGGLVRGVVRPGNTYTPAFPEAEYRAYSLLDAGLGHLVWAFVRRGSPQAEWLEGEFNESSILLEKKSEVRATLRLSGPAEGGEKLFVITEMLHKGWVSP
ncbi:hypothetical protein [Luteolibacter marinus]|uniref:hypothetical protein n=1 Tax=Luteolibacter marinus TaxID=2776705 RepID=UPI00186948B3|nr:hypothetical protein [Luteolibacter marinus]